MKSKNIRWIVRSSGKILGPYVYNEIAHLLNQRQVVVLDEVCAEGGRWIFIRDEPVFNSVVEGLRQRTLKHLQEDTTTSGIEGTQTLTPAVLDDDRTQDLFEFSSGESGIPALQSDAVRDVFYTSIDDIKKTKEIKISDSTYTYLDNKFIKNQAQVSSRWIWVVTICLTLFTLSFVLFSHFVTEPIQSRIEIEQHTYDGIAALEIGQNEKALDHFEKAYFLDPNDKSLYLYLGILRLQIAEQPGAGQKLLLAVRDNGNLDLRRVYTALGIADLLNRKYEDAEKNFNKALEIDPLYHYSMINLGALAIEKKDYASANNHLLLTVKEGSLDGAEHLLLVDVAAQLYEKDRDPRPIRELIDSLSSYLDKSLSYSLEIKIALGYLESLVETKVIVDKKINSILNTDFFLQDQIKLNLFVFRKRLSWTYFSQWCLKMTEKWDPLPQVLALEAMCLFKAGDHSEANRKIVDAVNQNPKDSMVQSVYSYILYMMKLQEKALVAAERAVSEDTEKAYAQPRRMRALICTSLERRSCALQAWNELLFIDPKSMDAIVALAEVYRSESKNKEMKKLIQAGESHAPMYKPLLQLSQNASRAVDKNKGRGL